MQYLEFKFSVTPQNPYTDILIANLADIGFDSFSETEGGVNAYISKDLISEEKLKEVIASLVKCDIQYSSSLLEEKNWNEEWESNFQPVVVEELCMIRAPFHSPIKDIKQEIVINPKMSFGTGHHETTYLMIKKMFSLDFNNKQVLDMGCGTGVLAILASKLGAENILAIDINEWAFENSEENCKVNSTSNIEIKLGDATLLQGNEFDIILANINKNILKQDLKKYSDCIKSGGVILLSGFFENDVDELKSVAEKFGFVYVSKEIRNNWALMHLIKQ